MRPCVFVQGFFRQTLQQQAGCGIAVGGQRDVGFQLFGTQHVVGQHFGDAAALQRYHALPRLAVLRLDGNDEYAVFAQEVAQGFVAAYLHGFVPTRGGAAGLVGSGFHHQHFQTALPLNLHNQRAFQFQVARQQCACGQQFAQRAADGGGILFAADNVPPHFLQPDMQAADGHVVENKAGA